MSRGKTFVFVCTCIIFAMFGLSCYLMGIVNPAKLDMKGVNQVTGDTVTVNPAKLDVKGKNETLPDALRSDLFLPRYDLKNAGIPNDPLKSFVPFYRFVETNFSLTTTSEKPLYLLPYSAVREVFPPLNPPAELSKTEADLTKTHMTDHIRTGVRNIGICNKTENLLEITSNKSGGSLPAKGLRRSINNVQQNIIDGHSRPILLKIIDESGWPRIEIKLNPNKSSVSSKLSAHVQNNANTDYMADVGHIAEIKLLPNNTVVIKSNKIFFNKTKNSVSEKEKKTEIIPNLQKRNRYNSNKNHSDNVKNEESRVFKTKNERELLTKLRNARLEIKKENLNVSETVKKLSLSPVKDSIKYNATSLKTATRGINQVFEDENNVTNGNGSLKIKHKAESSDIAKKSLLSGIENNTEYSLNSKRRLDKLMTEIKRKIESEAKVQEVTNNLNASAQKLSDSPTPEKPMQFKARDTDHETKINLKSRSLELKQDTVNSSLSIKNPLSPMKKNKTKHYATAMKMLSNVTLVVNKKLGLKSKTDSNAINKETVNNDTSSLNKLPTVIKPTTNDLGNVSQETKEKSKISDPLQKTRLVTFNKNNETDFFFNETMSINDSIGMKIQLGPNHKDQETKTDLRNGSFEVIQENLKISHQREKALLAVVKNETEHYVYKDNPTEIQHEFEAKVENQLTTNNIKTDNLVMKEPEHISESYKKVANEQNTPKKESVS